MRMRVCIYRSHPRARRGFTIMEVMLAIFVFFLMTMIFAAVFPLAVRAAQFSNNYAQAAMLAQHKIDQLRAAGWGQLNSAALQSEGIVNSQNADGTFDFTTVDHLVGSGSTVGYFPPGSTGTVAIADNIANNIKGVTVTIRWQGAGISAGSYSLSSMIIQMPHN